MKDLKTSASEFLATVAASPDLQAELKTLKSRTELLSIAEKAGYKLDNFGLSIAMRSIAAKALEPYSLPHWAVESMFLGEAVCW